MIRIKSVKRKNPTDHELLNKIRIEKEINNQHIIYYIIYNNEIIGDAYYSKSKKWISSVDIENKFQRKGLATFLYNYIEADLGIKLQPSNALLSDGKAFWKNRLKKSNPTDKNFLSKIKIEKVKTKYYIRYQALLNNATIATADFFPNDNSVSSVYVDSPYRRKGLASFMYNTIEKDQKVSLQPSQDLLSDGRRFWENRLKGKPEKLGLLYR